MPHLGLHLQLVLRAAEVIAWASGNLMVERKSGLPMWPGLAAVSCRLPPGLVDSYAARSKALAAVVTGGSLGSWADFPREHGGKHPVYLNETYVESLIGPYMMSAPGVVARRNQDIHLPFDGGSPVVGPAGLHLECGGETGVSGRPLDGLATDALAAQRRMGSRSGHAGEVVAVGWGHDAGDSNGQCPDRRTMPVRRHSAVPEGC